MVSRERPQPSPEITIRQKTAFDREVVRLTSPRNQIDSAIKLPDTSPEQNTSYRKGGIWIDLAHPCSEYIPLEKNDPYNTANVMLGTTSPAFTEGYTRVELEFFSLNLNTMDLSYSRRVEELDADGKKREMPPLPTKNGELDIDAFVQKIKEIVMFTKAMGDYDMTQERYDRVMDVLRSLTPEDEIADL